MTGPEIREVTRLALNPGDTIAYEADHPLTADEALNIKARLHEMFPGRRVGVVSGGRLVVVEPEGDQP